MKKVTIVMVYYQRQNVLNKTLESLKQYDPKSFNVIIVDNVSPDDIILPKVDYPVRVIKQKDPKYKQVILAYNEGFKQAINDGAEIIVFQCSECAHSGDVLSIARKVKKGTYFAFPCYSLKEGDDIDNVIINNRAAKFDGDEGWYNHELYSPRYFNFCAAMTADDLIKINGFDERFKDGIAYEDDYLVYQLRQAGIKLVIPTYGPFVFHQWHYNTVFNADRGAKISYNKELFVKLIKEGKYKALHLITPDL